MFFVFVKPRVLCNIRYVSVEMTVKISRLHASNRFSGSFSRACKRILIAY